MDLYSIKDPSFLKQLSIKELKELAKDIRAFLLEKISATGGHLASNLGIVEITIALHYVFNSPQDALLFDVGHQAYTHKILTGRAKDFDNLRKIDGLSGYINRFESDHDIWESGHSSTSLSAQCGMLYADKSNHVVSVIGDASMANGIAFEAMNFISDHRKLCPIIILNDNEMSISKSVGGLSRNLNSIRSMKWWSLFKKRLNVIFPTFLTNFFHKIKRGIKGFLQADNIFEDMGLDYFGPYDGNDLITVIKLLEKAKKFRQPCLIHFITKKGKGYVLAEENSGFYHGIGAFNPQTGASLNGESSLRQYSEIATNAYLNLREEFPFTIVCPAMINGSKLDKFAAKYPDDIVDVGISEEHAAVFSAGMLLRGKRVILAMYSTFAQRAYDFFLNDIARQNLPVIVSLDRAGVVGEDGATHHGLHDIAMFSAMPNFVIAMPSSPAELRGLFRFALQVNSPFVIRFPRLEVEDDGTDTHIDGYDWEVVRNGSKGIVIAYGEDLRRITRIVAEHDFDVMIVNARFIKPLDRKMIARLVLMNKPIMIYEQVVKAGSLGALFVSECCDLNLSLFKFVHMGFRNDEEVTFGSINDILKRYGLSDEDIILQLKELYG